MAGARRSAEKEAFWRLVLEEHRASGQSVRAFCKQESLSEASFYAWRKELGKRDQGIERPREGSHSREPAMLPVSVVDSAAPSRSASSASPCWLEVLTPSGFTLRFDHHIEPAKLRVLLHAVASCSHGVATC